MFGTGRAEKRVKTHFTRWHESFIRGFLNWIVQCVNACVCVCVCVCVDVMPKRSGWLAVGVTEQEA